MDFLKNAHSLIFKMLKNSVHSNHTHGVEFLRTFPEICRTTYDPWVFFSRARSSQILFGEQAASFVISFRFGFAVPEVVIMDVETMVSLSLSLSLSLSCRCQGRLCCSKRENESPQSYLDGPGDGCFLCLVQGDETTIGYFNQKDTEDKFEVRGCGCR